MQDDWEEYKAEESRNREIDTERERDEDLCQDLKESIKKNSEVLNSYLCTFRHFDKKHFDCLYELGSANAVYSK